MRPEQLLDAIGEVRDEYLSDVQRQTSRRKPRRSRGIAAIAACLVLALGVHLFWKGLGGRAGGGGDSDLVYMSYAGPVLPLNVLGDASGVSARRDVTLDFSPYQTYQDSYQDGETIEYYDRYYTQINVTDGYVLQNETEGDLQLTLCYPFAGTVGSLEYAPEILVDGTAVETALHPGPYCGTFQGAIGSEHQGSLNLREPESFGDYVQFLTSGAYQDAALDAFPSLDVPVVVYKLHDYVYSQTTEDVNPTLAMDFTIDFQKTAVFSWNMNGTSFNPETGFCSKRISSIRYRANVLPEFQHPEPGYVILLGADLEGYTIQGYRDGGCDQGEELGDLGCTVTRYETTLEAILRELLGEYLRLLEIQPLTDAKTELCLGLTAELIDVYSPIGSSPVERYDSGDLEDIFSNMLTNSRVIYKTFAVTIPAGASISVTASMCKDASIDYVGKDRGKDGYDLATTLGSNLRFLTQTASITGCGQIEIVGQNFGFDPDNGVTSVSLELTQEHYWIEVRKSDDN